MIEIFYFILGCTFLSIVNINKLTYENKRLMIVKILIIIAYILLICVLMLFNCRYIFGMDFIQEASILSIIFLIVIIIAYTIGIICAIFDCIVKETNYCQIAIMNCLLSIVNFLNVIYYLMFIK